MHTVFALLCFVVCGHTLTDFPISIRLTSLALWQSNDCPSASKATLMNMDKYFMWIHYERLHNHNKAKHNKTVCIFLGIYCICWRYAYIKSFSCHCQKYIWVGLRKCGCHFTWFCYRLIAKPCNKTAALPWPNPSVHTVTSTFIWAVMVLLWYALTCLCLGTKWTPSHQ